VCASESCGSSHNAQPSIYRNVNSTLFSCHSKTNPSFLDPGLFNKAVAQFIGLLPVIARSDLSRRSNLGGEAVPGGEV